MVIDFRSRPPYKSFATNTALFPRKVDEDFESPELVPALNMNSGEMESAAPAIWISTSRRWRKLASTWR